MALLGALVLPGCRDMGLEDNLPLADAESRPPSALVEAVMAPTSGGEYIVDGRLWIPSGLPLTLRAEELRPVGSAGGRTVFARSWDEAPYDALFTRLDGPGAEAGAVPARSEPERWVRLEPVIGRSGRVPSVGPVDADVPPAGEGEAEPGSAH